MTGRALLPAVVALLAALGCATAPPAVPVGPDPREAYPIYDFTPPPGDVRRLPADFEPLTELLLGFPEEGFPHTAFFAELIAAAAPEVAGVVVHVPSAAARARLTNALLARRVDVGRVRFAEVPLDTMWIRDYGPLLVETSDGGRRVVDLRYSYGRWQDDAFPTRLARSWGLPVSRPPLAADGGNLLSDGTGRCITTERVLLQNRRRSYTRRQIRDLLRSYLGCRETAILPTLVGEGTGHADLFAAVTGPGRVLVGRYDPVDDPVNAAVLDQAANLLADAGFAVTRIPMPGHEGLVFRTYTNALIVGGAVLVPVYADDRRFEREALETLRQAWPGKRVVPIDATGIIRRFGGLHCVGLTAARPGSSSGGRAAPTPPR